MKNRIEIEELENGYTVTIWKEKKEEKESEGMMYPEPEKYVAKDKDEAMKIFKENF